MTFGRIPAMSPDLGFELLILQRMLPTYQAAVLGEIGLTETEAALARSGISSRFPADFSTDFGVYANLLGPAYRVEQVDDAPPSFAGSTAHYYLLMLWPHLFWVVNCSPSGTPWNAGFRNQVGFRFSPFDPRRVRVGLWTRSALEEQADRHELYDGWDENSVVHFSFGSSRYEARFTLELLEEWKQL